MNSKIRNIFFCIGLVAIVVMCFTFNVSFAELWQNICHAGYWLVAIIMLWGCLYAMNAWAWMIIIKGSGNCPIEYWRLLKLTITGFALNSATPVGLLGGEPYKIMELTPYIGVQRATSSVVLFSMMHIFSHFWFWLTAVVTYIVMSALGYLTLGAVMGVILFLMSLFCFGGIYLFVKGYKNGMIVKLINLVCKIPGLKKWGISFRESHQEDLSKIDKQISELQGQNKHSFYASLALEYIGRILQSLEIYFVLLLFGTANGVVGFVFSFLILAFTSLFANMMFFFPMQIGGREGGFAMSTAQMGLTNAIGIFISLICRVREVFWTAVGLALMKVGNPSPTLPEGEGTKSAESTT